MKWVNLSEYEQKKVFGFYNKVFVCHVSIYLMCLRWKMGNTWKENLKILPLQGFKLNWIFIVDDESFAIVENWDLLVLG